jgi:threonine dehydrogenase-like Zn-dependent dehydrogenase
MVKLPVIPGHEIGAVVEKVGEAVPEIIRPGMTVTVNPYTNCGKCPSCRNGRVNACQFNETLGVQRNGAMRERMVLPWTKIIPAEGLDVRTCALVEPMSVGFHAVERGAVSDIDTVMVIGCGMVGLGAVVRSALRGATVIAADIDEEKLALACQMGAAHTVNTMTEDVHARLQEITAGAGPDVIIEAVGNPHTYRMAVDEVAFTGRVVCIGYANSEVSFQTKYFVQKELDIRGSRNAMPSDFRAVIRYMQKGECPVDRLVSMVVSPQEAEDAMNRWAEAPGKVFRILVKF